MAVISRGPWRLCESEHENMRWTNVGGREREGGKDGKREEEAKQQHIKKCLTIHTFLNDQCSETAESADLLTSFNTLNSIKQYYAEVFYILDNFGTVLVLLIWFNKVFISIWWYFTPTTSLLVFVCVVLFVCFESSMLFCTLHLAPDGFHCQLIHRWRKVWRESVSYCVLCCCWNLTKTEVCVIFPHWPLEVMQPKTSCGSKDFLLKDSNRKMNSWQASDMSLLKCS